MRIEIDPQGLNSTLRRVKPELYKPVLEEVVKDATNNAENVAAKNLDSLVASRSILSRTDGLSGRVWSAMSDARTRSIEEGRRPGQTRVYTGQLSPWARRVGYRLNLFTLQKEIYREGVKAKHFFKRAKEDTEGKLDRFLQKAASEIESRFRRGLF